MSWSCLSATEKSSKAALALAGALCLAGTLAPVGAAPGPIMLSDVARGTGGFVINGSRPYAQFGSVVSGGADANGDGLSDIQVGFRTNYSTSISLPDVNYLVHGKPDGIAVNLSRLAAGQGGGFVAGATTSLLQPVAALGYSAAMGGDINGDGLADFVTTARGSGTGSTIAQRFVVFGQTGISPVEVTSISAGTGGFVVRGSSPTPTLGPGVCRAVAGLGDVNGDGLADIGLACPTASTGGIAYVVFGRTDTASLDHTTIEAGTGGFVVRGTSGLPVDGQVVALGDVNGDGLHDLLVSGLNNGTGIVVFGKTSTTAVEVSALGAAPDHEGYLIQRPGGTNLSIWSGAGDVNGDGLGDVVVNPTTQSGVSPAAIVAYGKSGAEAVQLSSVNGGTAGFRILSSIPFVNPRVPAVAANGVGDLNGDGFGDLAVSIVGSDYVPTPYANSGRVYVIFGTSQRPNVQLSQVGATVGGFTVSAANSRSWNTGGALAPGGDIDGDGLTDLIIGSPGASVSYSSLAAVRATTTPNWSTGQIYAIFNPLDPAPSSTYIANVPAGNPGAVGPGGRSFGRDATIHVDGRAWVDFADGTGPGLGGSSTLGVTITRSDDGIGGGLAPDALANVQWSITSNRTNTAPPRVSVRYTNDEIAGLNEGGLQLLTAPTTAGPFVPVGSPQTNAARNMLSGTATLPAVFVIVDASPRATITRLIDNPTLDQNPAWQVTFDKPMAPSFTLLDIVPTGSLANTNLLDLRLSGLDPNYVVQAYTSRSPDGGTLGFTIPAGAASSNGLVNVATEAPPYSIQAAQPAALAGDMNKDSVVNVADVTALADHIVNGTPLP